jgi:hypothetical protein
MSHKAPSCHGLQMQECKIIIANEHKTIAINHKQAGCRRKAIIINQFQSNGTVARCLLLSKIKTL